LIIRRFGSPGAFLAIDADDRRRDAPTILLLGSEIPEGVETGAAIDVFVYLDSEGRPLATTRTPKLELGEVAFLEVTALTKFGAFVDWGLALAPGAGEATAQEGRKELLVPFAEQTTELQVGARHPIGLYLDDSKRLAGTMRVTEMLRGQAEFERGEWVAGETWRNDPDIGLFVIIERSFIGLVPKDEPHALSRGEAAQFRVANVLPDGKIELSLRGHAHEELEKDGQKILDGLARPGAPRVGDRSSPEEIRALFGLSKKAFKRAVGRLLKQGTLSMDANGFLIPKTARGRRAPTPPSPRGGGS